MPEESEYTQGADNIGKPDKTGLLEVIKRPPTASFEDPANYDHYALNVLAAASELLRGYPLNPESQEAFSVTQEYLLGQMEQQNHRIELPNRRNIGNFKFGKQPDRTQVKLRKAPILGGIEKPQEGNKIGLIELPRQFNGRDAYEVNFYLILDRPDGKYSLFVRLPSKYTQTAPRHDSYTAGGKPLPILKEYDFEGLQPDDISIVLRKEVRAPSPSLLSAESKALVDAIKVIPEREELEHYPSAYYRYAERVLTEGLILLKENRTLIESIQGVSEIEKYLRRRAIHHTGRSIRDTIYPATARPKIGVVELLKEHDGGKFQEINFYAISQKETPPRQRTLLLVKMPSKYPPHAQRQETYTTGGKTYPIFDRTDFSRLKPDDVQVLLRTETQL